MDEQLLALYHRHVGMAFDKQMRFVAFMHKKLVGGAWEYDPTTATLSFDKVQFEAPILGSHARHNNSWLWAWSNKHLKLSLTNRALGDTIRAVVHRLNVHALGAPAFALEPLLGTALTESAAHILGVILVGELGYEAYHALPNEDSQELVLIRDDRLKFTEKRPLVRIATQFTELLRSMPVLDDKAALSGYAHDYGLIVTEEANTLKITAGGKDVLTATFDGEGHFAKFDGIAIPEPKPAKKVVKKKPIKKKPVAKAPAKKAPATKKPVAKTKAPAAKASKKPPAKNVPAKKPIKKR